MDKIHTLQLIGSKSFGGAERWFQRFSISLDRLGHPTELGVRRGKELDGEHWHGIPCHSLAMHTVWDPFSKWEISSLIQRIQPDIVQTYMGRATRLTHLRRGRGPVHVARIGGYYKLDGYHHAHAWIGNTKGICDYLRANGFPHERIFHIYNFFEPPMGSGAVARRADWGIPQDAWILMTPGRLVPVKGQKDLLAALGLLPHEIAGRPVWLLVLGDGPLSGQLRNQARQLQLENRIVWAGWQSDPAPFYRMADMIAFPSLDEETFGNVILEAWAYGKPLVTTAFRGAREIVKDAEDALMVPCEAPAALAHGIRTLSEDTDMQQSLVREGEKRLEGDFSKQAIMAQYIDLYAKLVGQH